MVEQQDLLAPGDLVSIRLIRAEDLEQIAPHAYSVSVVEPLNELDELRRDHSETRLWLNDAGAASVVELDTGRLVGTCQFFRSGPCIHGLEIGYIIHDEADWGKGFATEALRLFSAHLFECRPQYHRHQLTIETTNKGSCRVAEKGGFIKEGTLRKSGFPPDYPDCFVYSKVREGGE